jgi:NAD(P)-dependent dehydrogenase (short-subunit alcohol dehydrogenase family)
MLATEIALKGIPVRVNAIAPGVYESEMTLETIASEELVNKVGNGIQPIPAKRAGTLVLVHVMPSGMIANEL